jgi:hypothetical protein
VCVVKLDICELNFVKSFFKSCLALIDSNTIDNGANVLYPALLIVSQTFVISTTPGKEPCHIDRCIGVAHGFNGNCMIVVTTKATKKNVYQINEWCYARAIITCEIFCLDEDVVRPSKISSIGKRNFVDRDSVRYAKVNTLWTILLLFTSKTSSVPEHSLTPHSKPCFYQIMKPIAF